MNPPACWKVIGDVWEARKHLNFSEIVEVLQVNPLSWQIITSEINHADSTMAT